MSRYPVSKDLVAITKPAAAVLVLAIKLDVLLHGSINVYKPLGMLFERYGLNLKPLESTYPLS